MQRLLEKVNRVPLHEDFHFRVTNGQRAEVKRALHCEGISLISASDPSLRIYMPSKRIITTTTNLLMSVPILNRRDIVHLLKDPVKMFYILVSDRFCNAFYGSTAALEHCTCFFHSDLLKNISESQS